ncbi:hypothetical protein [Flavobacterium sp. MK4S-17]|uniref:hypothetical protein n=1 Tax=Flavobacterium sp. MK4S-17 TaxID=2543737 RepID=UPI00135C3290|nr:hypothetical protein [Flavobacterium sp. MK4S-17]
METIFQIRHVNGSNIDFFSDKEKLIEIIHGRSDIGFRREIILIGTTFELGGSEYKIDSIEIEFNYILDQSGNRLNDIDYSKAEVTVVVFVEYN